jgi:hypothetical protein
MANPVRSQCPKCGIALSPGLAADTCPACGVLFAKLREPTRSPQPASRTGSTQRQMPAPSSLASDTNRSWTDRLLDSPLGLILLGCIFVGIALMEYGDLADWERTGGRRSFISVERLLYDLGGKALVAGFLILVGGILFFTAYITFSLRRRRRPR